MSWASDKNVSTPVEFELQRRYVSIFTTLQQRAMLIRIEKFKSKCFTIERLCNVSQCLCITENRTRATVVWIILYKPRTTKCNSTVQRKSVYEMVLTLLTRLDISSPPATQPFNSFGWQWGCLQWCWVFKLASIVEQNEFGGVYEDMPLMSSAVPSKYRKNVRKNRV